MARLTAAQAKGLGRKAVFAKTNGRCAYCGVKLRFHSDWNRDHVIPLVRYRGVRYSFSGRTGCKHPELHTPENVVAACRSCNKDKGACDLETWRAGLRWVGWRGGIVFYFERCKDA